MPFFSDPIFISSVKRNSGSSARTIADLEGSDAVRRLHVAEALSYRRRPPGSSETQSGSQGLVS